MSNITYIRNEQHYNIVLQKAMEAKKSLWIGTADIKDLYVKHKQTAQPFLRILAQMLKRKVIVRVIHAKEPGSRFRDDFDKNPVLVSQLERVMCPRVHFKLIIVDHQWVYIGSANLTGAAMGMKSTNRRNFETGIWTSEAALVNSAVEQFDEVWMGAHCKQCGRRDFCSDRIV